MPKICRWGNSLGLRLPKEIAVAAGLFPGVLVRIRLMDDGSLRVTPIAAQVAVATMEPVDKSAHSDAKW